MLTRSLFLLLLLDNGCKAKFLRFVERCPTRSERRKLSLYSGCVLPEVYHCTRDDDLKLVEICNEAIQLPPGNYPRYTSYTDRIFYDICPDNRTQPWPVKSNEIADCELEKSNCSGVGQLLCNHGTTTGDVTCRCDFKNGFVIRSSSTCCSPSSTDDCYCEHRPCHNSSQELNSEYKCVDKCRPGYERKDGEEICSIIEVTNSTDTTTLIIDNYEPMNLHHDSRMDNTPRIILGVAIALFVVIDIIIAVSKAIWKPFRYKFIPFSVLFVSTIVCLAIGIIFVNEQIIVKVAYSILTVTLICVFILVLHVLDTHDVRPTRKTYDMQCHFRVYQLLDAASKGDLDIIRRLRSECFIDLSDTDYDQRSALHLAASEGQLEVVNYLLKHRVVHINAVDRWKNNASNDAERHMRKLTEEDVKLKYFREIVANLAIDLHVKDVNNYKEQIANKLVHAAETGNLTRIKKFHKLNTDMDLANSSGRTALQAAVDKEQTNVVKYLLNECKVSPFVRWKSDRPNSKILDANRNALLHDSESFEQISDGLSTEEKTALLLLSASRGDIRKIRGYAKAYPSCMNLSDYDQRTALHVAVSEQQEHIVEYLIQVCNVDINLKDRWGRTALDEAIENEKRDILQKFRIRYKDITDTLSREYKTFQLLHAVSIGNYDELKRLHEKKFDMEMRNYDGRTALHLAAVQGDTLAVDFLINTCMVKTNIPDREGRTPAEEARKRKEETNCDHYNKVLKILNSHQSDVQAKDHSTCRDPIYEVNDAVEKGDLKTLKELDGVCMDAGDYMKETPLHVAAAKGQLELVKHLVEVQKVSLFVRNSFWETPIRLARKKCRYWKTKLPDTFHRLKKEKNLPGTSEKNPGDPEWVHYGEDLQSDSDTETVDNSGKGKCRIRDRVNKFSEISKYLCQKMRSQIEDANVEKDESISKYSPEAKTFLFLNKIFRGDIAAVKRFVATDESLVNKPDYDKRTALHIAVSEGHYHLVIYLLKKSKETKSKDRWGNTPEEDASHNKDSQMIDIFKTYSCGNA